MVHYFFKIKHKMDRIMPEDIPGSRTNVVRSPQKGWKSYYQSSTLTSSGNLTAL